MLRYLVFFCMAGLWVGHAEESKGKASNAFSIPVWHADARWQIERYAGCGIGGHLEGPRLEMEYSSANMNDSAYSTRGGKYHYAVQDTKADRGHSVTGGARGTLDGPFSRARFGGFDYVVRIREVTTQDKRYHFLLDRYNGGFLRRLDFKEQMVKTIRKEADILGLTVGDSGQLYLLDQSMQIIHADVDGKSLSKPVQAQGEIKVGHWGASLAVDEKNGKLYATGFKNSKAWYIWSWDLKDGRFEGVLPMTPKGKSKRGRNVPGAFEGVDLYDEGRICFGPDDPEKRFLYTARTDTWSLFRLDLKKKEIWALTTDDRWGKGPGKINATARFIKDGKVKNVPCYSNIQWVQPHGSFVSNIHTPYDVYRFKRVR